jgi:Xaa-Pro aminopeptidase
MLTAEGCHGRRMRLIEEVRRWKSPAQWILLGDPRHLMYLANFPVEPISWSSPPPGLLLIEESGHSTLFVDNLAVRNAETIWVDKLEVVPWYTHRDSASDRRRAVIDYFLARLPKAIPETVALETSSVPAGVLSAITRQFSGTTIVPIDQELLKMRRVKWPDELALLSRCIAAGEAGHARSWEVVRAGATELEVYVEVSRACSLAAGSTVVVYGDFCSGPRTWLERGGPPTHRRLEPGDLMILDFSVVMGGYRGDFTNTIAVGASPTAEQRRLFDLCAAAMNAGEQALAPGTRASLVFERLNDPLSHADPRLALAGHGGHGIGLAHPEPPIIVPRSDDQLIDGDVITLEPGAYVAGVGGMRFENNYRVHASGFERLTNHRISLVPA